MELCRLSYISPHGVVSKLITRESACWAQPLLEYHYGFVAWIEKI